jgi:hypothetical protein
VCLRTCSLINAACNAYAPYCDVICGFSGSMFFDIFSQTARFSEKNVTEYKTCLIFSTTFIRNISHSKKNSARYCHKCRKVLM